MAGQSSPRFSLNPPLLTINEKKNIILEYIFNQTKVENNFKTIIEAIWNSLIFFLSRSANDISFLNYDSRIRNGDEVFRTQTETQKPGKWKREDVENVPTRQSRSEIFERMPVDHD